MQLFTDVSQNASRKPWAEGMLRSLTTSSDIYAHGLRRKLHVCELYKFMGFESIDFANLSPVQAKDLLGEAMAVPVITMVSMALIVNLPVWA
eukprot:3529315-Amphidinium_carterae.4